MVGSFVLLISPTSPCLTTQSNLLLCLSFAPSTFRNMASCCSRSIPHFLFQFRGVFLLSINLSQLICRLTIDCLLITIRVYGSISSFLTKAVPSSQISSSPNNTKYLKQVSITINNKFQRKVDHCTCSCGCK